MGQILRRMRSAFSLTPRTLSELKFDIESWAETLVGIVPVHRLEACYDKAMATHARLPPESRRFPLVATELTGAMIDMEREILAQELAKQRCIYCTAHRKDRTLPPCPFHSQKALSLEAVNRHE